MRSLDLSCLDYFLWVHMSDGMFSWQQSETREKLLQGIMESADHIQGNYEIIKKAANSLSCSFPCSDIAISHKTLKNAHLYYYTTLLTLCYSNMFQLSRSHLQGLLLMHVQSKVNKYVYQM